MLKITLCFIILALHPTAFGQYESTYDKYRWLSVDLQYVYFSDIAHNPNGPKIDLDPAINTNLNFRFYRIFSLLTSYGKSPTWNYFGVGFKVDLPGLLFFDGRTSDLNKKYKKQNWNSYLSFSKLLSTDDSTRDSFVCDRMGFGLDYFVYSHFYANLETQILSYQGNQFFSPSIGVGIEF